MIDVHNYYFLIFFQLILDSEFEHINENVQFDENDDLDDELMDIAEESLFKANNNSELGTIFHSNLRNLN